MSGQKVSEKTTAFVSKNIVSIASVMGFIMTWGYQVGVKQTQVDIRLQNVEQGIKDNDFRSDSRDKAQQKEIDKLSTRQDETDKTVAEISKKLDVAVAILTRIENQVKIAQSK